MSEVRNWATSSPVAGDTAQGRGGRTEPLLGDNGHPGLHPFTDRQPRSVSVETSDSEHPPAEPPREVSTRGHPDSVCPQDRG